MNDKPKLVEVKYYNEQPDVWIWLFVWVSLIGSGIWCWPWAVKYGGKEMEP